MSKQRKVYKFRMEPIPEQTQQLLCQAGASRLVWNSYKTNAAVLRETISSAVEALGAGKILPEEMPIDPKTNANALRYAPSFASVTAAVTDLQSDENTKKHPYTVEGSSSLIRISQQRRPRQLRKVRVVQRSALCFLADVAVIMPHRCG